MLLRTSSKVVSPTRRRRHRASSRGGSRFIAPRFQAALDGAAGEGVGNMELAVSEAAPEGQRVGRVRDAGERVPYLPVQ